MERAEIESLREEVARLRELVERQQSWIEASGLGAAAAQEQAAPRTRRGVLGGLAAAFLGVFALAPRGRGQRSAGRTAEPSATAGILGYRLHGYTGEGNSALGRRAAPALDPNDTASARWCTAVGVEAMQLASPVGLSPRESPPTAKPAQRNSALGRGALRDNSDGFYNDALGADAGRHCTRAFRNTFLGNNAGKWVGSFQDNGATGTQHPMVVVPPASPWVEIGLSEIDVKGCRNVMIGRNAGHWGISARDSVAVGYNAGAHWDDNANTVAVGRSCLFQNRDASQTVAIGAHAMVGGLTGGTDCVAIGYRSLASAEGNNDVAVGAWSGELNGGGQNVFVGEQAGRNNAGGIDNVMVGRQAGLNSSGSRNIFLGRMAGRDEARSNMLVVHNSGSLSPFLEGSMGEGGQWHLKVRGHVLPNASGVWTLGSSSARWSEIWSQNGTINPSDVRMKKEVADEDLGLDFIEALRPVVWRWKDGDDRQHHRGLIAQEVREAARRSGTARDFAAVVDRGDEMGLCEREFLSPMVKAIQQLAERVRGLEARATQRAAG